MQPARDLSLEESTLTWPRRALWIAIPAALALGLIGGIGAAVYGADPPPPAPQVVITASPAPSHSSDPSAQSPEIRRPEPLPPPQDPGPPREPNPSLASAPRELRTIRDARAELLEHYSVYRQGSSYIPQIDYQVMRNNGLTTSLVGILSVEGYAGWLRAQQEDPGTLTAWLEAAVRRVQPAVAAERFFLAWAVVDVRQQLPQGFADAEVAPLESGAFLIVRPLASIWDPSEVHVALRPLPGTAASAPRALSSPWLTYGPVLRFDASDLYRPAGAAGTRPR